MMRKDQRVKADIKGLPHLATAPPPCRPGPRAQPGWFLAFPFTVSIGAHPLRGAATPALRLRLVHAVEDEAQKVDEEEVHKE